MNMKTQFIFLGCNGLAIQDEEKIYLITDSTKAYTQRGTGDIVYLLQKNGKIKCILPASKTEYESFSNQDRRQLNVANGFTILWFDDGYTCVVTSRQQVNRKLLIISSVVSLFVGVVLGCMMSCSETPTETTPYNQSEKVQMETPQQTNSSSHISIDDEKLNSSIKRTREDSIAEINSIKNEANHWIDKFHKMDCTLSTIEAAEKWWKSIDPNTAKETHINLDEYINAYKIFFTAETLDEMYKLCKNPTDKCKRYFSSEQWRVIKEMYCRDTYHFRALHRRENSFLYGRE